MSTYDNSKGNRSNVIKIDGSGIRSQLSKGKFQINETAGTYSGEELTTKYHQSLFAAIDATKAFWEQCVQNAGVYIDNFESVTPPADLYDDFDK